MKSAPLIGITSGRGNNLPKNPSLYERQVAAAGGNAAFISPETEPASFSLHYDGFIIPGGKDLDPSYYKEAPLASIIPEEKDRIDFEFRLLRAIIPLQKPVLGICYGMQLINVFLGGSLYQDLSSQRAKSLDHAEGNHQITIDGNPYLDQDGQQVNSSHHQGLRSIGQGIKPFAYAPDGVIEAFYVESYPFFLGVQWHPERMDSATTSAIFNSFIWSCHGRD